MLQGLAPGLNTSIGGNLGFEPGAEMRIQIRGQGSVNGGGAFVVIDGIPGDINTLNPNDIESISVLKDAAASAIYGARAPYGVILVTTKSGQKGKLSVNYNGNVSLAKPIRVPEMVDSYTHARAINEAGRNGGGSAFSNETIDRIIAFQNDPSLPETVPSPSNPTRWGDLNLSNANYDWFDVYYGDATRTQQNISVSGGTEKSTYYLSGGYVNDEGILNYGNDFFKRYNLNGRLSTDIAEWWNLSFRSRYQRSERVRPNFDNQGEYELLFHQIARTMPNQALKSPNGYYTRQSKVPWTQDAGQDERENHELWQTIATQITPLKGLKVNADFSFRMLSGLFTSKNFVAYEDLVDGTLVPIPSTVPSSIIETQSNDMYYTSNVYGSYQRDVADRHHFLSCSAIKQNPRKRDFSMDVAMTW
jgi:TonB-dependent SusC/RagA subfamily outer membrane receptor